jgi:hypothetical protein
MAGIPRLKLQLSPAGDDRGLEIKPLPERSRSRYDLVGGLPVRKQYPRDLQH